MLLLEQLFMACAVAAAVGSVGQTVNLVGQLPVWSKLGHVTWCWCPTCCSTSGHAPALHVLLVHTAGVHVKGSALWC